LPSALALPVRERSMFDLGRRLEELEKQLRALEKK
jgi:hypothetical protein